MLRRSAIALVVAALASTGFSAVPASSQERVLRFSHTDTATGARQQAAELFAERVAEYSDGRLKVEVFHSGQLANDAKAVEQLQLGGLDFTVTSTGTYATHVNSLNLLMLPYIVDNYEDGWKLYDQSEWIADAFNELPAKGVRILSTWEAGFRSFTTKMPIRGLEDMEGAKIRVFPNDMIRWIMESFGYNPVILPITEVYLAIQQGAVLGQENPIDTINSQRFYEVAPHLTLTQHVYSPIPLAVSERTWQSLSPEDQSAVEKAAVESADWIRKEVRANDQKLLDEMTAKGAEVHVPSDEELAEYKQAMEPVYEKAREAYGADAVDNLLGDASSLN